MSGTLAGAGTEQDRGEDLVIGKAKAYRGLTRMDADQEKPKPLTTEDTMKHRGSENRKSQELKAKSLLPIETSRCARGFRKITRQRKLQHYLHTLRRRSHLGIVLAGLFNDRVNARVGMVRVVVEENKFLRATFHHHVDGFTPVAVSPALFARGVFFRKILRVVDEHVSAFSQLADTLIKHWIAWLVVR